MKFHSLEQFISLSYYSFYLSCDPWELLFGIVNELCWNCFIYCFQNVLFKIYPDLTSGKIVGVFCLRCFLSVLLYKNIFLGGFFILSGLRLDSITTS